MSVNRKMTEIAETIRTYTGGTAKLSLERMVTSIEEVFTNGYSRGEAFGYNNGFADGKASNFEVHKITVASDLTSGTKTILSSNQFIKTNYAKEGFSVQLISLSTQISGPAIGYAYNGNRNFLSYGENTVYGCQMYVTASSSVANRTANVPCYERSYNGLPYVNSEGDVLINNNASTATLKAGDYLIILSVAEV